MCEYKKMSDFVHFLGYHENPFPIIRQCDVVCMMSKSEGFPMCLLESVALQKPFVSTVIGGSRILTKTQHCGRIIETDQEAADAILELLDMDKHIIDSGCNASIKRFLLPQYIREIEKLFDSILDGGGLNE